MKKITVIIAILTLFQVVKAQDQQVFVEENTQFTKKSQYLFNTFIEGKLYFNDGTIGSMGLNYNVIQDEFHYLKDNKLMTFAESAHAQISKVELNGKHFVVVENSIYQIIYPSGVSLLKRREADIEDLTELEGAYGAPTTTSAAHRVSKLSSNLSEGMIVLGETVVNLNDDDHKNIKVKLSFKLKYGNSVYPSTKGSFLKIYKEHKNEIKAYVKENKINFDKEDDLLAMIRYCKAL